MMLDKIDKVDLCLETTQIVSFKNKDIVTLDISDAGNGRKNVLIEINKKANKKSRYSEWKEQSKPLDRLMMHMDVYTIDIKYKDGFVDNIHINTGEDDDGTTYSDFYNECMYYKIKKNGNVQFYFGKSKPDSSWRGYKDSD